MDGKETIYNRNKAEKGCGYYSVCWEHACPCSSDSKVMQGYNEDVWSSLVAEGKKVAKMYDD